MSQLRFNHVFVGLLVLSLLSGFVISPRYTNPVRAQVQGIFFPVSRPTRALAGWVDDRFSPPEDGRPVDVIEEENRRLKSELGRLTSQIEVYKRLVQEQERLGPIADITERVPVMGTDAGRRDSLSLQGTFSSAWLGQPVMYTTGGVIGRIERAGAGGAQVRLLTDKGIAVTAEFHQLTDAFELRTSKQAMLEGNGNGMMIVRNMQMQEAKDAKLQAGDYLLLADSDWPDVSGQILGQVTSIEQRPDAPLNADIHVKPIRNLMMLREVRVVKPR